MIKGKNLDKQLMTVSNKTVFDLSESPTSEMVLLHATKDITLNNIYVVWVEASSADTGSTITVGTAGNADEYFTAVSEVSQAAGVVNTYGQGDMVLSKVPAGTPVYIGATDKTGAGTCFVTITYTIN